MELSPSTIEAVGACALGITLVYTGIGLPAQIIKNHKRRSVKGLSRTMTLLSALTFYIWTAYGLLKGDPFLIYSNVVGSFFVTTLLAQFYVYK